MRLVAKWIWKKQRNRNPYNQTVVFRKSFKSPSVKSATMAVTADSWYRLRINGEWVNDGPCRSWPDHYQYDELDVTSYLQSGDNTIEIVARYFGVGTFHQVPREAGLLAQVDITTGAGREIRIITDRSWEVAEARAWTRNVPKVSIQMEPFEEYDARRESLRFAKAVELYDTNGGPWRDLHARDCALLSREPFALSRFVEANLVKSEWMCHCFPLARLLHPGVIEANHPVFTASVIATVVVAKRAMDLTVQTHALDVAVNGKLSKRGVFRLRKGRNLLVAAVRPYRGHHFREPWVRFVEVRGFALSNPMDPDHDNPWCLSPLPDMPAPMTDLEFGKMPHAGKQAIYDRVERTYRRVLKQSVDAEAFKSAVDGDIRCPARADMVIDEVHKQFVHRQVLGRADDLVHDPAALMHDNAACTVVRPCGTDDIELVYDLGEQNCGYYEFDLTSDEGVVVDVFATEYITRDGTIQHTNDNHNGLRYVCKQGRNRFTSLKRRSGRYLFVTLRNMKGPVSIRNLRVIESTYPVNEVGRFSCSDRRLAEVWSISARTLKLCMEDTFTDCPLYEQTLWVGDARNEAVFAFTAFGAEDLARRCITLTGQSLERYPITGCQVPSCWDCLLPAWSFLWGISVWDYYWRSGDTAFLKKVWPWVKKNLKGAEKIVDERGLFSGPFWNMFDWSGIDDQHATVVHNSMFAVGAIDAALKCAQVLNDRKTATWLRGYRTRLVTAVNALWDDARQAYPDSIHADGAASPSTCQHTSFLSVLYDIVEDRNVDAVMKNVLDPPEGMVGIGSPFAIMYLYEALEKTGNDHRIIESIYDSYLPMLEDGATTVWESFATGTTGQGGFPTRSHCHAWSSAPVHFLNRIILGIRQTGVGGAAFDVSPRLSGLSWAEGATDTARGPVTVSWRRTGKDLDITASAPRGVKVRYTPNDTHAGLTVRFNGRPVNRS